MVEQNIELWKEIEGYSNYMISNLGRVKSLNYNRTKKEKIMKFNTHPNGYLMIMLSKNNKQKVFPIHRLVAEHFIPNPENKPCIDHINTIRTDNRVDNLRWVTHKENMNNPITKEKISKQVKQLTIDGKLVKIWNSNRDIEKELGYYHSTISYCCNGKQKTAYGYIWKYEGEKVA